MRVLVGIVVCLLAGFPPAPALEAPPSADDLLQISSELRVGVRQGREIELSVLAGEADDYTSLAHRFAGGASDAPAVEAWNSRHPVEPGTWVRVPLPLLSPEYRALVLRNLFPEDTRDGDDWIHVVRSGKLATYDEGLWQIAQWFTGRGAEFERLMQANSLSSPEVAPGQRIRIPADLLHRAFKNRMRSDDGSLEYGSDADGPFAAYRLQPGEALYSAVVVRFTGRTGSEDVVELAGRIVERSRIKDARDIPVGYEVRIPLDLLEPDYLPADHPRRLQAEAQREERERALVSEPVARARKGLDGVIVILDPGHGGRDLGTMNNGIWEHDYVYDVACRLKRMLERETTATVLLTLEDRETGCVPSKGDKLVANKQGTILTAPPFLARAEGEAKIGVNLRWYLANSIYRKSTKKGTSGDRIVFMSLHADARHPSLRGAMVYVPGADYRTRTYGHSSRTYKKFEQVREQTHIKFSRKERVRSEAVSRKLAKALVSGMRQQSLPIQTYQPIRDKIIRGKQKWVPAVLRANAVPTKVLVEMVNLSNKKDAALLSSAAQREKLARGLLDGLRMHFGESGARVAASTAAP